MKSLKTTVRIFIFLFLIVISADCAEAYFENETVTMTEQTGELSDYADSAAKGKLEAEGLWEYITDIFLREFKNIAKNFPSLFSLAVLFSLKNCVKLDESISKLVNFAFMGSVILMTSGMMKDMLDTAREVCEALGVFVVTTVPCLCGVLASSGMPVSASKGAFIILGASNILSFLINSLFFPVLYITYILSVSSVMVENDIFESVKKTVLTVIKISLPFFVGIFTTVLTMFMKSSSKIDDFVLKSAKLTIGNTVPFLGNVLSDSAEVVVSSVGQIKSQLGIIGIFGILSVLLIPLIKMLCTIAMFKILSMLCCFLADKKTQKYYDELSEITGVMAGMTGTMAVMTLIGILILMG